MASFNRFLALYATLGLLINAINAALLPPGPPSSPWGPRGSKWSTIWATAPQLVEPNNLPPQPYNISGALFQDTTLRQTVKVTLGAPQIRLRFSNAFSLNAVTIDRVAIALPVNGSAGVSSIQKRSSVKVTFNEGSDSITLSKASLAVSDPINFPVKKGQVLAITVYLKVGVTGGAVTGHPGSRTDSWLTFGDQVDALELTGTSVINTAHWYFISGIEGYVPSSAKYLSIIGDSITDGRGSTTNQNNRWPDKLSAALGANPATYQVAVGNQGLGGNCVLSECLGPNALSRIDRDVIAQSGITYAMIFEGINDIGGGDPSPASQKAIGDNLINAYKQFITRVHAAGLPAFGATITPFGYSFYDEPTGERQKTKARVNEWILKSVGKPVGFDAVVDFDKILRDPKNVTVLRTEYDSGDFLHPNPVAYDALIKNFPLNIFR